jgi:formylglycine-generating enzyme required for sulfatase activity
VGNLNSFAFQMGKRYQFTFDFDGASYPRIEFSVGSIDEYDSTQIVPTPPALQLLTDGTERTDTLLSGLEHLQIPAGTVQTNQQTWTAEVTSGAGWLSVNSPMGYDGDKLSYSVQKNRTGATRIGTITLYADTAKRVFTVTQEAYDGAGELTTFSVSTNTGTYNFDVAFIPKGKFWTGGTPNGMLTQPDGKTTIPSAEVTLTQDYYMGTTTVTNTQFAHFLNDMGVDSTGRMPGDSLWIHDSKKAGGGNEPWALTYINAQWQPMSGYDDYPVMWMTWYGAAAYCNWLNSKISGYHFSLPTEAQWERAALCGTPYKYNGMSDTWNNEFGWITGNSGAHTHEVGTAPKGKNIWNMDDMCGNLWEWCSDWFGNYPAPTAIDPTGAAITSNPVPTTHVFRGGSFDYVVSYAMATQRGTNVPNTVGSLGFRVCAMKDNHIATPLGGTIRKVSVNTTSGALNFQLAFIPKGKFWTGGTPTGTVTNYDGSTIPSAEVTLTQNYYLGTTEVTNLQFAAFLNEAGIGQDGKMPNDSVGVFDSMVRLNGKYPWGMTWNTNTNKWVPCAGYENFPAIWVNWFGANAYCDWLNTKKTNLTFKLPTEAQWQNAAQGGTQYVYNGLSNTWNNDFGWVGPNGKSHAVGTAINGKNPWNLNDMCGNAWEWCSDIFGKIYPAPTPTDPTGATMDSESRVSCGGGWLNTSNTAASAYRCSFTWIYCGNPYGFRVCAMAN